MFKNRLLYSFIIAVIVSLLFVVELQYIITYAQMNSLFLFESDYLTQHLSSVTLPGKYISDFIAQFFYYPTLGVIIIGIIYGIAFYCITSSAKNSDPLMLAIPLFMYLLVGCLDAKFMYATTVLLICSVAIKLWSMAKYNVRLISMIPLVALLYYFVGMYCLPVIVFMTIRLLSDASNKKSFFYAIPTIIAMAAIPYIISYILVYPLDLAYSAGVEVKGIAIVGPIVAMIIYVLYTTFLPAAWFQKKLWQWISLSMFVVFITLGGFGVQRVVNTDMNNIMKMEQAAAEEQWDQVLELSRESPQMKSKLKNVLTNVALFRKGLLTEQLLDYDQSFAEQGLFFRWDPSSQVAINNNDLVYANVGLINEAFRYCFESWESRKVQTNYRKLIAYSELLGRDDFADRFKRKLDKSLFYTGDSHKLNFAPANIAKCDEDYVVNNMLFADNLKIVLDADSTNYAAFDYLAASYLLSNQVSKLAQIIPSAITRYNGKLPRLYNEALMILSVVNPKLFEELGYVIPEDVVKRFDGFNRTVFASNSSNPRANAENSYGNSYWFYLSFVSPYGSEIR